MEGYLRLIEVAKRLGLPRTTVNRMVKTGLFPNAIRQNPFAKTSPILIPEKDLEDFIRIRKEKGFVANGTESNKPLG